VFFRVPRELVGEPIEELDHPGAPLSKCCSRRDDVSGTAEARPLKDREHQIVAVAWLGACDEWLLGEQSLQRQACRVKLGLPSRAIGGCLLEALPQHLLARASEIFVIFGCKTPDKIRVDQAAKSKIEDVIRPKVDEARGATRDLISKEGRLVGKAVFEVGRDLPGVVNDFRIIDDDGHEVLSAEPLDGVNIGEAHGAIFDVDAFVGEGVADVVGPP